MGRDKALVQLGGRTLAARAVELLRNAGLSTAIAGARSDLGEFAPVVADKDPEQGPLGGICSAIASTDTKFAVFIPVDLPLMPVSLIRYLLLDARITGSAVTLASINGFTQTFPAVLRRESLPILENELAAGRSGCYAAFQAAAAYLHQAVRVTPVEVLAQAGQVDDTHGQPPFRWFLNANTPTELERVRQSIA
jgi:molybdopterin-guanine dinucleotide biosynthesis protein A